MQVSVTGPIDPALSATKRILLAPFDLVKWFKLGFCAFLASLASNCAGGNNGLSFRGGGADTRRATYWVEDNGALVLIVAAIGLMVGLALYVLFIWLQSRGRFMFVDGVVKDRGAVAEPWRSYKAEGDRLFRASMIIYIGFVFAWLAVAGISIFLAWGDLATGTFGSHALTIALLGGGSLLVLAIAAAIVDTLLNDFVVPAMYARRCSFGDAWDAMSREVLRDRTGTIVLYLLMKLLIAIASAVLTIGLVCVTLCIAACFLAIPYVGTVVLLPLFVFQRCYSLYFLQQFGGRWDLFASAVGEPNGDALTDA